MFDCIRGERCVYDIKYLLLPFLPLTIVRQSLLYLSLSRNTQGREFWGKKFDPFKVTQVVTQVCSGHTHTKIRGNFCYFHCHFHYFSYFSLFSRLIAFAVLHLMHQEWRWHSRKEEDNVSFLAFLSKDLWRMKSFREDTSNIREGTKASFPPLALPLCSD